MTTEAVRAIIRTAINESLTAAFGDGHSVEEINTVSAGMTEDVMQSLVKEGVLNGQLP